MKIQDLFSMALKNLSSRKLRTFLTVLGVIIGTTSIVVMLSIGFGFQRINTQMYANMGNLTILDMRKNYSMSEDDKPSEKKLDKTAISEIKKIPHIDAVMPVYMANANLKSGRYTNDYVQIMAIDPSVMEKFDYDIADGRLLNSQDRTSGVVFSGMAYKNFRDEKRPMIDASGKVDPMNSRIEISDVNLQNPDGSYNFEENPSEEVEPYSEKIKVVGQLVENENDWSDYNTIYMSIDYFEKLKRASESKKGTSPKPLGEYSNIKLKVDSIENVKGVQEEVRNLGYDAANIYAEILENSNQTIVIFQAIFGAIGAVAFLVATIGIANTMIMAIYERTKEIGVMKVIGASFRDIEKLFLTEAGFIGLFGGILGIILSLLLSNLFNFLTRDYFLSQIGPESGINPQISYIPFWLIIVALVFSTLVGVLAGYLPAKRAMKLSALDAIRTE